MDLAGLVVYSWDLRESDRSRSFLAGDIAAQFGDIWATLLALTREGFRAQAQHYQDPEQAFQHVRELLHRTPQDEPTLLELCVQILVLEETLDPSPDPAERGRHEAWFRLARGSARYVPREVALAMWPPPKPGTSEGLTEPQKQVLGLVERLMLLRWTEWRQCKSPRSLVQHVVEFQRSNAVPVEPSQSMNALRFMLSWELAGRGLGSNQNPALGVAFEQARRLLCTQVRPAGPD